VVTQVLVDKDDPSFKNPSKPIGSFMEKEEADKRKKEDDWDVVEDAGRGWRRVVASPLPQRIMEFPVIESLVNNGFIVAAVGGGGIPVIENDEGDLVGTAAVIDKDFASSLLARQLKADVFIISTAVEKICINFGKPDQKGLDKITVAEAKKYIAEGHFKPGSMLPKVKAVIQFLEDGGKHAVVTDPEHLAEAMAGKTGTHLYP
ncbi:carbamate kinase, partial [Elusimicrobiota bacterium]